MSDVKAIAKRMYLAWLGGFWQKSRDSRFRALPSEVNVRSRDSLYICQAVSCISAFRVNDRSTCWKASCHRLLQSHRKELEIIIARGGEMILG